MMKTFNCPSCGGSLELPHGSAQAIRCPYCNNLVVIPQEFQNIQKDVNPEADQIVEKIKTLLQNNQKIEAIKLYRQNSYESLAEAKEIVEQIEEGIRTDLQDKIFKPSHQIMLINNDEIFHTVSMLLDSNKKIDAIKVVREHYHIGLAEAKSVVEQIEAGKITSIEKGNIDQHLDDKEIKQVSSRAIAFFLGCIILCVILFFLVSGLN